MTAMGRHSPPIVGTIANGHQLVPLAPAALQKLGPVSALPRPAAPDDPGQSRTAADDPGRWRHAVSAHRGWLAAVPIVLVNAVAFAGQLAFLRGHLPWPAPGQVLVAVTLESVAVYLAWQAHLALAADDSALRLRLAAYGFAAVIGVMNYSHYMAPHWRPTFAAVTFGLMSVSSPWLWSVHSRRVSRDALKARGLIEPHAVRLGATRWLWHPSLSFRVMRWAAWTGEADPARAIAGRFPPADDTPGDSEGGKPPAAWQSMPPGGDKAAAIIRDRPGLTNAEVAELAECDRRTVQRARNGGRS
jgi:hypothetical protein